MKDAIHEAFTEKITSLHKEVSGVTGSSHILEIDYDDGRKVKLLVDVGTSPQISPIGYHQLDFNPAEIDAILITHAHQDHVGLLPYVYKNGFKGYVYAASPNVHKGIIKAGLLDSAQSIVIRVRNKLAALFSFKHVHEVCDRIVPVTYNTDTYLHYANAKYERIDDGLWIRMLPNGHLPGAAVIDVYIKHNGKKRKIRFLGDYKGPNFYLGKKNVELQNISDTIKENYPTDVVTEATYGDRVEEHKKVAKEFLTKSLLEGKSVQVLTFANFRAQQVLHTIACIQRENPMLEDVDVYLHSPLTETYNKIYHKSDLLNPAFRNFMPKNIWFIHTQKDVEILKRRIGTRPFILITSGPDGRSGTSTCYLEDFLWNPNSAILFSSTFHFNSSLIEELQLVEMYEEAAKVVNGEDGEIHVKADYCFTGEYSLHALQPELVEAIRNVPNLKNVFINHGTDKAKNALKEVLEKELPKKVNIFVEDRNKTFEITNNFVEESTYEYVEATSKKRDDEMFYDVIVETRQSPKRRKKNATQRRGKRKRKKY